MNDFKKSKRQSAEGGANKSIVPNNMTDAVKRNLEILNDGLKKIKAANNKEKAKALIKLYQERKISNARTVTNQIFDFIAYESKTAKQRETIDKNHAKLIEKYQNAPTSSETQRKSKKENKAARKIQKLVTGKVKLEANIFDRAMNKNLISVEVKPVGKGDLLVGDLEATLARAYLLAKRKIPKWEDFKIFGSIKYELSSKNKDGVTDVVNHMTKSYPKAELGQFFAQLTGYFASGEYAEQLDINSLRVQFHFAQIPTGKGCGTTERDLESVFNKKSVLKIVNDDNNCFWYAMACLTNPENKTARKSSRPNTRIKLGKELCNKTRCNWDEPFSFLQVSLVEEKLNCNIYILDVFNIPMLGSTISLMMGDALMYKSENRNCSHYFLLHDEVKQHYDCITDIKKHS